MTSSLLLLGSLCSAPPAFPLPSVLSFPCPHLRLLHRDSRFPLFLSAHAFSPNIGSPSDSPLQPLECLPTETPSVCRRGRRRKDAKTLPADDENCSLAASEQSFSSVRSVRNAEDTSLPASADCDRVEIVAYKEEEDNGGGKPKRRTKVTTSRSAHGFAGEASDTHLHHQESYSTNSAPKQAAEYSPSEPAQSANFVNDVTVEFDAKIGGNIVDVTDYVRTLPREVTSEYVDVSTNPGNKKSRRKKKKKDDCIKQNENEIIGATNSEAVQDAHTAADDDKILENQSPEADHDLQNRLETKMSKAYTAFQGDSFGASDSSSAVLAEHDLGRKRNTIDDIMDNVASEPPEKKKSRHSKRRRSKNQKLEDSNSSIVQEGSLTDMCSVSWIVQACLHVNQRLFLVGGHSSLGSWDPTMAIGFSEYMENGQPNLWVAKAQVPFGTHCDYNYFIQVGDNANRSIVWRPGSKLHLVIPSLGNKNDKEMVIKCSLDFNVENRLPALLWGGLPSEIGIPDELKQFLGDESRAEDLSFSDNVNSGGMKHISITKRDKIVASNADEDDATEKDVKILDTAHSSGSGETKTVLKHPKKHQADEQIRLTPKLKKYIRKRVFPREEPWLMESMILHEKGDSFRPIVVSSTEASKDIEEAEDAIDQSKEPHILTEQKKEISTEILISSSKCTMERIAILENGKLVELLLKQVNADINVGNVYLGVVKKLLPGMTGVFVDIGHSRVALLSINKNVYPYTFPRIVANDADELAASNQEEAPSENGQSYDLHSEDLEIEDEDEEDDFMSEYLNQEGKLLESNVETSPEDDTLEKHGRNKLLQINGNVSKRITVNFGQRYTKWRRVEEGMRIIVQVKREPLGKKGPKVCAFPQLSSRFWVLGWGGKSAGVSKKISGPERKRLKDVAKLFRKPGFDLTARTEAAGQSQEDLEKDLMRLMETWKGIIEQAEAASMAADNGQDGATPVLLHRAMGQTLSIVRDFFAEKVHRMVVDSAQTYHEVTSYLQEVAPKLLNRVELYTGGMPIFDVFNLEPEIDRLLNERVQLPNGAYLVIQETEALVSIDVNGGTGMLGKSMKSNAILEANLAAARQIAIELRLRDIGGIIVIDFIDMDDDEHESLVYQEMRNAIQSDRSVIHILEISELGIMELTRRRKETISYSLLSLAKLQKLNKHQNASPAFFQFGASVIGLFPVHVVIRDVSSGFGQLGYIHLSKVRPSVTFMISDPCPCCHGSGRVEALETTFSKIERAILRLVANYSENIHFDGRMWKKVLLRVDPVMFEFLTRKQRAAQLSSSLKVYIILKVGRDMLRGSFELNEFKLGNEKKTSANGQHRQNLSHKSLHLGSSRKSVPSTS